MNTGLPKGRPRAAGFTIVETLIVLAVTGALFVSVAITMSGRQSAAQFTHAIQNVQAQLQQIISQVGQGFYPSNANFQCSGAGSVSFSSGSNAQGTNAQTLSNGCVFLGKVVQFSVAGPGGSNPPAPELYRVYTVAGLLSGNSGGTTPFTNAKPAIVGVGGNYTDYSDANTLQYGLTTLWVRAGATNLEAVGFLMEPGSLDSSSTNGYSSGIQQVDLVGIRGSGVSIRRQISQTVPIVQSTLQSNNPSAPIINPSSGVQICFVSGGTNQSGKVTVGGNGRQLTVTLDIRSNKTCT